MGETVEEYLSNREKVQVRTQHAMVPTRARKTPERLP
jgi:hypothetical protein